ncbi:MAG: regulatory protein RecX [Candidatus Omnitrophica bacterium]|nr:regulatory protein RecX [Candidatus Omnitrophota bacterium]
MSLERAKEYAFLLLKFRQRSEKEISARLKKKNFQEKIIKQTLAFLREKAFIDDESFARAWINQRVKRPYGLRRITRELRIKGIDEECVAGILQELKESYNEEEVVRRLAKERFDRIKGIEPPKAKKRIYSYLLRRGFSPEIIIACINNL